LIASFLVAYPTGDQQAKMAGRHQPLTLAAMEGKLTSGPIAGIAVIGQPNIAGRLDNPIKIPGALSFWPAPPFKAMCSAWRNFLKLCCVTGPSLAALADSAMTLEIHKRRLGKPSV